MGVGETEGDAQVPFLTRLKAWWDGTPVTAPRGRRQPESARKRRSADTRTESATASQTKEVLWPSERIELCKKLWGEGFVHPGGRAQMIDFVKPLALDPAMSVLDLSPGLGGGSVAVSKQYGVWITAMDQDAELVEAARSHVALKGMKERVRIGSYDPWKLELPFRKYDCAYARETFFMLENKFSVLKVIAQSLKPGGQLLLTDYVLANERADDEAVAAWREAEPQRVVPATLSEYRRELKEMHLDVRIFQDDTDALRRTVVTGWKEFIDQLRKPELSPEFTDCMWSEAIVWHKRILALESAQLRLLRVHALSAEKKLKLMSD